MTPLLLFGGVVVAMVLTTNIPEYWLVAAPILVGVVYLLFQVRRRATERTANNRWGKAK